MTFLLDFQIDCKRFVFMLNLSKDSRFQSDIYVWKLQIGWLVIMIYSFSFSISTETLQIIILPYFHIFI